jgi:hypothetical protein
MRKAWPISVFLWSQNFCLWSSVQARAVSGITTFKTGQCGRELLETFSKVMNLWTHIQWQRGGEKWIKPVALTLRLFWHLLGDAERNVNHDDGESSRYHLKRVSNTTPRTLNKPSGHSYDFSSFFVLPFCFMKCMVTEHSWSFLRPST